MHEYTLIKSKRKTVSVEIRDGAVLVRAPRRISKREADAFVDKHTEWIERQLKKYLDRQELLSAQDKLSENEISELYRRAKEYLPARAREYADMLGVDFGRVTIRCQRTRWGSCSAKKNLNFNCLLMLAPEDVRDSVVAHEVCHLVEMNHSARFYALVLRLCPDYRRLNKWLKDNGDILLARAENG